MNKLYFFTEARYIKKEGNYYNPNGVLNYRLFQRYLNVFDHLIIVARVRDCYFNEENLCTHNNIVNGDKISVHELCYFVGPFEYLKNKSKVKNQIEHIIKNLHKKDRCLLRVPGNIGDIASNLCRKHNVNYAVEVVGDPIDVFSKGSNTNVFRLIFKYLLYFSLKKTVLNAIGVCYITKMVLPIRYPSNLKAFVKIISNVRLDENDFVNSRELEIFNPNKDEIKLISIGSLEQMYKSPDIVIKAVKQLIDQGYNVKLTWVGDGKYKKDLINLVENFKLESYISFIGYLNNKSEINRLLDSHDIFVLVSRAEAQGRVILEAMARGKIVVGSNVGGIPENVDIKYLVPKEDVDALVQKIIEIKSMKSTLEIQTRNLQKSKEYNEIELQSKRDEFLIMLKNYER